MPKLWLEVVKVPEPMLQTRLARPPAGAPFEVGLARSAADVLEAQRLRYEVFALEMGAKLPSAHLGLDRDRFDPFCDHLVVREHGSGRIVGTYRMLPPDAARRAGGWYCADEFDVGRLAPRHDAIVEIGRACVDPDYRSGTVIALLWAGLLRYVLERGFAYAIGCASLETTDGGHIAASVCRRLLRDHTAGPEWRVTPRQAFVLEGWKDIPDAPLPPLIKGYLRLGARICGEPAWDPDFDTADLLVVLPLTRITPRYVERLLRTA